MSCDFPEKIFNLNDRQTFTRTALEIFRIQSEHNQVYKGFIYNLGRKRDEVQTIDEIPFLPVEFFRTRKVMTGLRKPEIIFESSTTTRTYPGYHYVARPELYEASFLKTFRLFFGDPGKYIILALLPSYTDRKNSSLIYMVNTLIKYTHHPLSGFYINDAQGLIYSLKQGMAENRKTILFGVSFALLDLAENFSPDLSGTIIIETGGMKGKRKEITRQELHEYLKSRLNVPVIHSEYGMTELLSQAYSHGEGIFYPPPWMKVLIRDATDPLSIIDKPEVTGGINIVDLANIDSCSFIATGDLGKLHSDGGFEVLGRFDNSEIRGCNLLIG
jgi:hypothetical protein